MDGSHTHAWLEAGCKCTQDTAQGVEVKLVPTKPFDGQKTGTSGLRKKTEVFTQEHYLANWYVSARLY